MDFGKFFTLLSDTVDVGVYPDLVPEGASLPAVSYTHIGLKSERVLSGKKTGFANSWRVSISATSINELVTVYNQISGLDNQSIGGYRRIFTSYQEIASKESGIEVRQAFIDLDTYD